MRVIAKNEGQLPDQSWVQKGDEFDIPDHLVSIVWMQPADGKPWPASVLAAKGKPKVDAVATASETPLNVANLRAQIEGEMRSKLEAELREQIIAEIEAEAQGEGEADAGAGKAPAKRGRKAKADASDDSADINDA